MDLFDKILISFVLVATCCYGDSQTNCLAGTKIRAGVKVVEKFYATLASDTSADRCPDLFSVCTLDKSVKNRTSMSESQAKWQFILHNKNLFLTDRYGADEPRKAKEFFRGARKMISFFNPVDLDAFTNGLLYVTLVSTIARGGTDGVYKEIAFPIVIDEGTKASRIEFENIKINGVLIDANGDFKRDGSTLYKRLGFP